MDLRLFNGNESPSQDHSAKSIFAPRPSRYCGYDQMMVIALPIDYLVTRKGKLTRHGRENLNMFADIATKSNCGIAFEIKNIKVLPRISPLIDYLIRVKSFEANRLTIDQHESEELDPLYVRAVFRQAAEAKRKTA